MIKRILIFCLIIILSRCQESEEMNPAPPFVAIDLHDFSKGLRGFNLLGKFDKNWSNTGFAEEDFRIMADLGFNFARLPLDFTTYTKSGDWNVFLEDEVAEIDQAVLWGQQYGVHICINLHRAPGYSVNTSAIPVNQQVSLWTDASAQEAFIRHWAFFAERYKDVPNSELSFNLINEPDGGVDEVTYVTLMKKAIAKIHSVNPNRVVFVDGLNYSNDVMMSLKGAQNVIQALHMYEPFRLTHYQASWVTGSDTWPIPVWPMNDVSGFLFGPSKPEYRSSLVLKGNFQKDSEVRINVGQVSIQSTMEIKMNGQVIYTKPFFCGPDLGTDWTEIISSQWGYQNISNKDYTIVIPEDGTEITISNVAGDWMTFNRLTFVSDGNEIEIVPGNNTWGAKQETYTISANGSLHDADGNPAVLRSFHDKLKLAEEENIPVMIQEFGVHNQTPHSVALGYLTNMIGIVQEQELGYAMWNFSGSMGIINSGRNDCSYESYEGKLLDREMLEIME